MRPGAVSELGKTARNGGFDLSRRGVRVFGDFRIISPRSKATWRPPCSFLLFSSGMLGSQRSSRMRKLSRKFHSL
jgi:hypothetical protein